MRNFCHPIRWLFTNIQANTIICISCCCGIKPSSIEVIQCMKWNRFLKKLFNEHSDRIGMEHTFLTWLFTLFIFSVDATNVNNNNLLKTLLFLLNSATIIRIVSETTNYFKTIQSDSFHRNIGYCVFLVLKMCLFFVLFLKNKVWNVCVVCRQYTQSFWIDWRWITGSHTAIEAHVYSVLWLHYWRIRKTKFTHTHIHFRNRIPNIASM